MLPCRAGRALGRRTTAVKKWSRANTAAGNQSVQSTPSVGSCGKGRGGGSRRGADTPRGQVPGDQQDEQSRDMQ